MNAPTKNPLIISAAAILGKRWGGHDVRSQPEEGDEGGDAGDLVPGREIRLTDIVLTDDWINLLIGDKAVHALFNIVPDKPREWMFPSFSRIRLDDKYKNCTASITFGVSNSEVTIERATFKNMSVKRTKTGDLALSLTVVGERPRCMEVLDLEDFGGDPVNVVLAFGAVDAANAGQAELPLRSPPQSSTPERSEEERQADYDRQLEQAAQHHEQQQSAA